jgi:REP element-mobilizing transposase RayT
MARPIRILYPGAIYHVTTRGNDRKELFQEDEDRTVIQQRGELGSDLFILYK